MHPRNLTSARAVMAGLWLAGPLLGAACVSPQGLPSLTERQWAQTDHDLETGPSDGVFRRRLALIGQPAFVQLPEPLRHDDLLGTAELAQALGRTGEAHRLFAQASRMPGQGFEDWNGRLQTAAALHDTPEVMRSLTEIAKAWPAALTSYPAGFVVHTARASGPGTDSLGFPLRLALHQARFTGDQQLPPSDLWGVLAGDLAARGRPAEALEVAGDIDSPRTLLAMQVEPGLDTLIRQAPDRFDVTAAAQRQIAGHERAVAQWPRSLDALAGLAEAYLDAGGYGEVLRVAGAPLSRMQDSEAFHARYDDDDTALGRVLRAYARALMATQPWEDASGVMETAADDFGRTDPVPVIELAQFLVDLGRPAQAVSVLARLSVDSLPPALRWRWLGVRLAAAVQQGDAPQTEELLEQLRRHAREALRVYQAALLCAGREPGAARLLIARLQDPASRRDALLDMQIYRDPPAPPAVIEARRKWRALVNQPGVQHAAARVGYIRSWPLPPPAL